jgi:tetratricopeptide (TPR) repeat protein
MTFAALDSLSKRTISEFENLPPKEQKNAINYNKVGDEYYFQKNYNRAVEYYTKAIELEPNNANYYKNRSVSYNWLKEYEKAIADTSKAIELDPDKALYYYGRGVNYHELKEYEKAIADKSKAIELDPNNAEYYNSRGKNYSRLKEYEKAIADNSEAIKLDTNNVKYYRFLIRLLCRINDFDNAQINLNKIISLDGKSAIYYNTRGYIGMKKAKHDKFKCEADVLDDLNKAIELKNNDDSFAAVFYTDRAEYYLYSNEPDKAYNDLQKAVALKNMNGRIYFFMARYYKIKGNTQEYERCMDKMKECRYTPDSSDY